MLLLAANALPVTKILRRALHYQRRRRAATQRACNALPNIRRAFLSTRRRCGDLLLPQDMYSSGMVRISHLLRRWAG